MQVPYVQGNIYSHNTEGRLQYATSLHLFIECMQL